MKSRIVVLAMLLCLLPVLASAASYSGGTPLAGKNSSTNKSEDIKSTDQALDVNIKNAAAIDINVTNAALDVYVTSSPSSSAFSVIDTVVDPPLSVLDIEDYHKGWFHIEGTLSDGADTIAVTCDMSDGTTDTQALRVIPMSTGTEVQASALTVSVAPGETYYIDYPFTCKNLDFDTTVVTTADTITITGYLWE